MGKGREWSLWRWRGVRSAHKERPVAREYAFMKGPGESGSWLADWRGSGRRHGRVQSADWRPVKSLLEAAYRFCTTRTFLGAAPSMDSECSINHETNPAPRDA